MTTSVAVHLHDRRVSRRDRRSRVTPGYVLPLVIMAILFGAVGVLGYWLLRPYDVLKDFDPGPRRIANKITVQGGTVSTVSTVCKQFDVPGLVNRSFVDGAIFPTPTVVSTLNGCRDGMERLVPIPVPHSLPPGRYHLDVTVTYRVNPIRDKVYHYTTEEFEVLPAVYGPQPRESR